MNYDKYDQAITQSDAVIKGVIGNAELIVGEFSQSIPPYLSEWSDSLVKSTIKNKSEFVGQMNPDDLANLKRQLIDYKQSLPTSIKTLLASVDWAHKTNIEILRKSSTPMLHYDLTKRTSESLDAIIRESIGMVGQLLINYGLAEKPGGRFTEWTTKGSKIVYAYGLPDYPGSSPSSDKLQELRIKYGKCIEEYTNALSAKFKAEKDKSVAEAEDKWKSI